jgi:hypothetical protein
LTLALATFFMVRKDTLTQLDYRVGQVTDHTPTSWRNGCVRSNVLRAP